MFLKRWTVVLNRVRYVIYKWCAKRLFAVFFMTRMGVAILTEWHFSAYSNDSIYVGVPI